MVSFNRYLRKSLLKNIYKRALRQENNFSKENNIYPIWVHLIYIGHQGEHWFKTFLKKGF